MSAEDQIAELRAEMADMRRTIEELKARPMGISPFSGHSPLASKYGSLTAQAFSSIKAGQVFDDTQGKFFPIVVAKRGGITINTSTNFPTAFTFHETKNLAPIDVSFGMRASANLGVYPTTADTPVFFSLENAPLSAGVTRAIYLYSGFSTGGNPDIQVIESTGTRTIYKQTFVMRVKAGIPADGDFDVPASGMCVVDTTNNRVYFRVGSTWKFAALT